MTADDGAAQSGTTYVVLEQDETNEATWYKVGEFTASNDRAAKAQAFAELRDVNSEGGANDRTAATLVAVPVRSWRLERAEVKERLSFS